MKKILTTALVFSALTSLPNTAFAANKNVVFAGANTGRNITYSYFGGATALNGDIEKDGTLLRVGGGYGRYNYQTPAVTGGNVRGEISSSDLMFGYQQNFNLGRAAIYGGATYEDYKLNKADNSNRIVGGKFGGKTQLELTLNPTKNITLQNISNYSAPYRSYWSQTSVSWNFGKFNFGPEVALLGNSSFKQQRFGGNFSNIDIGIGKVYLGAGYLKSSGLMGDDGGYVSAGIASKF